MAQGLTVDEATKAVGVSRAPLYRWEKQPEPAAQAAQGDVDAGTCPSRGSAAARQPDVGKRKHAAPLRAEGVVVSASMAGRILRRLMDRGGVVPVPTLRRDPGARRVRPTAEFEEAGKDKKLTLYVLPPKARSSTVPSSETKAPDATRSLPRSTCRTASTSSRPSSTPSPIASTTHRPDQALDDLTPAACRATISSGDPASHKT